LIYEIFEFYKRYFFKTSQNKITLSIFSLANIKYSNSVILNPGKKPSSLHFLRFQPQIYKCFAISLDLKQNPKIIKIIPTNLLFSILDLILTHYKASSYYVNLRSTWAKSHDLSSVSGFSFSANIFKTHIVIYIWAGFESLRFV